MGSLVDESERTVILHSNTSFKLGNETGVFFFFVKRPNEVPNDAAALRRLNGACGAVCRLRRQGGAAGGASQAGPGRAHYQCALDHPWPAMLTSCPAPYATPGPI